jgi:hypothetical protein
VPSEGLSERNCGAVDRVTGQAVRVGAGIGGLAVRLYGPGMAYLTYGSTRIDLDAIADLGVLRNTIYNALARTHGDWVDVPTVDGGVTSLFIEPGVGIMIEEPADPAGE